MSIQNANNFKQSPDLLEFNCKNLVMSLKEQQNAVKTSLKGLKNRDEKPKENLILSSEYDNETDEECKIRLNRFKSNSYLRRSYESLKDELKSKKTVSFSDYLRASTYSSPRKVVRSASLTIKSPSKSILKKQLVSDQLSDNDEYEYNNNSEIECNDQQSDSSASTNSLLSFNIYGEDFDENLREIIRARYEHKSNKDSFMELVSKKRQSYLNHEYGSTNSLNTKSPSRSSSFNQLSQSTKRPVKSSSNQSKSYRKTKLEFEDKNSNLKNKETKKQVITRPKSTNISLDVNKKYKKMAKKAKKNRTILGYDWACDAIDTKLNTTSTKFQKPEEFWNELSNFREQNRDDCVSTKQSNFDGTISFYEMDTKELTSMESFSFRPTRNLIDSLNEDDEIRNHKCIHSFTLNERLFPVPVYKGKDGQSACPVCKSTRRDGTNYSPQYFKISIPKSKIAEPIKINLEKRSKMNPEDTLSLAEHCVAGYQNALKTSITTTKSRNIDLKSATGLVNEASKLTINEVKKIASNRDPATASIYNKAHAMRYELEDQHLKRLRELMPKINGKSMLK